MNIRGLLVGAAALMVSSSAQALQPLESFLASARAKNPEASGALANVRQREAEVGQARARLLPSLSARGVLTHNQYEAVAQLPSATGGAPTKLTILPQNQLDAYFTLDVPLIDLAQFARYGSQKQQAELAETNLLLTRQSLEDRVVRAYYSAAATSALVSSARKSLELAEKNRANVAERHKAGIVPELDVARSSANVERTRQSLADAELSHLLARRALETVSRLTPEPVTVFPEDDLSPEAPLPSWLALAGIHLPERRIAESEQRLADSARDAAKYSLVPSLGAQATERLTNATGFTGKVASYTIAATLSVKFDFGQSSQIDAASAALDAARAKSEAARRGNEDAIVEAWSRVGTGIAKAKAARAELVAALDAARMAEDRYTVGAATELDVTQAQRDAFAADVGRIQTNLDLLQARARLRLVVAKPVTFRSKENL